jgi:hypothetical protein
LILAPLNANNVLAVKYPLIFKQSGDAEREARLVEARSADEGARRTES